MPLKPIPQSSGTTPSEESLAAFLRSHYLRLWTYPNLYRSDGPRTKELADLALVFGSHVVLFSDKSGEWPKAVSMELAWSRFFRRSILASAEELWHAEKYVRVGTPIFLDARREHALPIDFRTDNLTIHLVAVVGNSYKAGAEYFAQFGVGSNGSFPFFAPLTSASIPEHPFFLGDLNPSRPFVHVIDRQTLGRVFDELSTLPDLLHYLESKEAAVRSGALTRFDGEEELLAFYLQEIGPDGFGSLDVMHGEFAISQRSCEVREGEWAAFEQSDQYRIRASKKRSAAEWLQMLERFHIAIVGANTGEADHVPLAIHESTLRAAASENLASQAYLARQWEEKFSAVPAFARSSRLVPSIHVVGRLYAFIFVPWDSAGSTYTEYRTFRLELMRAYAQVIRLREPSATEVILLGTEPDENSPSRSETMLHVMFEGEMTSEEREHAEMLMRTYSILDQVQEGIQPPAVAVGQRIGRNDQCPCGSGLKNKRCCNIRRVQQASLYRSEP